MPEHSHRGAHVLDQDRQGARQPERFDAKRASSLEDRARFEHLPPDRIVALLAAPEGRAWWISVPARDCTPWNSTEQPALKYHFVLTAECP